MPGERSLSGGGAWTNAISKGQYLYHSSPLNVPEGWKVNGFNGAPTTGTLRADVICLG